MVGAIPGQGIQGHRTHANTDNAPDVVEELR
jgi:hypothetical protein